MLLTPQSASSIQPSLDRVEPLLLAILAYPLPAYIRIIPNTKIDSFRVTLWTTIKRVLESPVVSKTRLRTELDLNLLQMFIDTHIISVKSTPVAGNPMQHSTACIIRPINDELPVSVMEINYDYATARVNSIASSSKPYERPTPRYIHTAEASSVYSDEVFLAWLALKECGGYPLKVELTFAPPYDKLPPHGHFPSALIIEDDDRPGTIILC